MTERIKKPGFIDVEASHPPSTLKQDVCDHLLDRPRQLPPKHFYDKKGSQLFDQICDTPEYYPTRTEHALLQEHAEHIIAITRPDHILEFGSGTARKTRLLLDACERQGLYCTYWAMDICAEVLQQSAAQLQADYPWLKINSLCGDHSAGLSNINLARGRFLALFLGSTIGNYHSEEASMFLNEVRDLLNPNDWLLLGIDRVKAKPTLESAYNDAEGLTAQFNLNLLNILNRELDADFSLENYAHRALYNEEKSQIEMHIVSKCDQKVRFGSLSNKRINLKCGETICTEISRKMTPKNAQDMIEGCSYDVERHFTPANEYFSLFLAKR